MLCKANYTREETQSLCETSAIEPEDAQEYDKCVNVDTIKEALSDTQELSDWTLAYASGDRNSNNVEGSEMHTPSGCTTRNVCVS